MKPRTKKQIKITELSAKLPAITEDQINWAKKSCFPHKAYNCKNAMWCSDCGKEWVLSLMDEMKSVSGTVHCPYCHQKLDVEISRRKKSNVASYMTIVSTSGEYQVLRHIDVNRYSRINEETYYFMSEVCQQWIDETANTTIIAKPMNMGSNGWIHTEDMSIKSSSGWGYNTSGKYGINGDVYPKIKLLPVLKRNGLKRSFHGITPSVLITSLLENGISEMLLKTKQYDLLRFTNKGGRIKGNHMHAINICNRNRYIVKDASMWDDYLGLLDYFNLDTHNAKYVCPKYLKKEHDILLAKKRKVEAKLRAERNTRAAIEKAKKQKELISDFYKMKEKFFGLLITDGHIEIRPLESVTQFYQEGKALDHCVYRNKYYSREDALVLSARFGDKRIETIEINLKTLQVIQSRGMCNSATEYHDRILSLVNKNINLIRRRLTA